MISPDGSRVVFAGAPEDDSAPYAVYAVDADGGPAELLVESRMGVVRTPTFSPDGTRIAYVDDNSDVDHGVWLMNADGSDVHQIVPDPGVGHVTGLAWSLAGDRIASGTTPASHVRPRRSLTQVIAGRRSPGRPHGSQSYSVERPGLTVTPAIADATAQRADVRSGPPDRGIRHRSQPPTSRHRSRPATRRHRSPAERRVPGVRGWEPVGGWTSPPRTR